jgi:hypothetical protein
MARVSGFPATTVDGHDLIFAPLAAHAQNVTAGMSARVWTDSASELFPPSTAEQP